MKLHPGCKVCKKRQTAPSDIIDEDSGKVMISKGDFAISCSGIPAEYDVALTDLLESSGQRYKYSPGEIATISEIIDPTAWAADNISVVVDGERVPVRPQGATAENIRRYDLDETAAYYQELMLKCTANRMCFRIGRRSGKSFTLALKTLHSIFTKNNYRVLVVTPYLAQLDLLFDAIVGFIRQSESLSPSLRKYRKTPQRYLELHNGSWIKGFTSGNDSIRGQAADMIVLDEADYLTTDDLSAIVAILTEHSDTILCASSTPSGARETFWRWDHDPTFRSFHYPSMCRPIWDARMEFEQKKENPGVKYKHEILAEYGEIGQGVFQNSHIDEALEDGNYEYCDQKREGGWTYSIGVDWNPVHGTEIMVVGATEVDGRLVFKAVDSGVVYREGSTQLKATEEIARMNRKWLPDFIYVDRGAGTVQVELREEMGELAPPESADRRLGEIITSIDFGSKIVMRHPVEGTEMKVYAKPAIVENAIRRLEAGEVELSRYDGKLVKQLRGFIVKKIGANGRPTYGMIKKDMEDHRLDAWILALFAFTMERTRFGSPEIIPTVEFTENLEVKRSKSEREGDPSVQALPRSRTIARNALKGEKTEPVKDEGGFFRPDAIASSSHPSIISAQTRRQIGIAKSPKVKGRARIKRSNF